MLFVSAPQRRKRSPAFAGSIFLHGALASVLALEPLAVTVAEPTPLHSKRKYSVVLLQFQPPPDHQPLAAPNRESSQTESGQTPSASPGPDVRRRFELPAARVQPVKQTLVQLDVPPDVVLKQDILLPTMLMLAQKDPPPFPAKRFVAPPLKESATVAANLPAAPTLDPPNGEVAVADLRVAALLLNELPHLPRPEGTTSPVRGVAPQGVSEIPQSVSRFPSQTTVAVDVISLPENRVSSATVVVVPPANQIAPAVDQGPGALEQRSGSTSDTRGSQDRLDDDALPGTTRITQPKDGKFGAVVLASAASSPYPESEGALRGKLVRTVYLRVGLRKSWILQYCLANTTEGLTAAALDAPWPFLMVRPDELNTSEADYVVIHGIVTAEGRFNQLTLIFPEDLAHKDLLINSLKRWEFRPASQAGQNAAVEVLLIIPRESE